MSDITKEIEDCLRKHESSSVDAARICRALRFAINEMTVTNAFAKVRLMEIEAILKGESSG